MIGHCPRCGAELGPAEDPRGCLTCRGIRPSSNRDRVVAVLETSDVPLAYWDVQRMLAGNGDGPVHEGTLLVWRSADDRTCWGGPGIYGLYRHGLIPGIRDLGAAASVFIHAAETYLSQDEARFVLQHVGYRFQSTSIYLALRRVEDEGLLERKWGRWGPGRRSMGPVMGLRHRVDVDTVIARAARQADDALAAFETEGHPRSHLTRDPAPLPRQEESSTGDRRSGENRVQSRPAEPAEPADGPQTDLIVVDLALRSRFATDAVR